MKRMVLVMALALASGPVGASAATETRTVVQRRGVFDLVGGKTDLRAVCAGRVPVALEIRRTAGDVAAAMFSGWWYTPVHLRVTCTGP
ncbi:MAG TPA: hypothetical protein VGL86_08985 [Polyangia bacterium]